MASRLIENCTTELSTNIFHVPSCPVLPAEVNK